MSKKIQKPNRKQCDKIYNNPQCITIEDRTGKFTDDFVCFRIESDKDKNFSCQCKCTFPQEDYRAEKKKKRQGGMDSDEEDVY